MNYHRLNKIELIAIVSVLTAIILLVGYNIGLGASKASYEPVNSSQGSIFPSKYQLQPAINVK